MMKDYFSMSIIELDKNDEIVNRAKQLNDVLMSIDVTADIHKQASNIGYDNIYTAKDIEKEIKYNIKNFGGG